MSEDIFEEEEQIAQEQASVEAHVLRQTARGMPCTTQPKEDALPAYVLLSTLTPEGRQTPHKIRVDGWRRIGNCASFCRYIA